MYQKMIKHITVADTVLKDVDSAASEIDRVLEGKSTHPLKFGVHTYSHKFYSSTSSLQTGVS
jgi:pyruvate decarboxylase